MKKLYVSVLIMALSAGTSASQAADAVSFPEGYRQWAHVKTLTLHKGHPLENPFRGIHHVYANTGALEGLRSGHYPDGAVLVFDLFHAVTRDKATSEGKRKLVGVMRKESRHYASTGGWGFEAFAANGTSRLTKDGGQSCFGCHTSQKGTDYVFSKWRP